MSRAQRSPSPLKMLEREFRPVACPPGYHKPPCKLSSLPGSLRKLGRRHPHPSAWWQTYTKAQTQSLPDPVPLPASVAVIMKYFHESKDCSSILIVVGLFFPPEYMPFAILYKGWGQLDDPWQKTKVALIDSKIFLKAARGKYIFFL